jgi:photosystem II stability/assembly factor-like uncharacterized protein
MKKAILFLLSGIAFQQSFAQEWVKVYQSSNRTFTGIIFTDSLTGYVCGDSGTILKTIDRGQNWIRLNTETNIRLNSIKFVSLISGHAVGDSGTILRTTDAGNSWQKTNVGLNKRTFTKVDFPSVETGYIIADSAVVLKTTNGGLTWSSPLSMPPQVLADARFMGLDFVTPAIGYACGGSFGNNRKTLFVRTTNGGLSWDTMASSLPFFRTGLWDVSFVNPTVGYATGIFGIVMKTTNGGDNWFTVRELGGNYNRAMYFINESTGWVVGSLQGAISFGDGMIKSTFNGGTTWNVESWDTQANDFTTPPSARLNCITTVGNDSVFTAFAVGSNGIIIKSNYTTTSTNDWIGSASDIQIFPNPTSKQIEVALPSLSEITSIQCFNSFGKEVYLQETNPSSANQKYFNIQTFSSGIYFIRCTNGEKVWMKKFVKE